MVEDEVVMATILTMVSTFKKCTKSYGCVLSLISLLLTHYLSLESVSQPCYVNTSCHC